MSVADKLREELDVRKVLEALGGQHIKGSGELRCPCIIHGGDNPTAFVINERTGNWFCHTGCLDGGDIYDLIMQVEEITFKQSLSWLADLLGIEVDWTVEHVEEGHFRKEARKFIEQMRKRHKQHDLPAFKIKGMKFAKVKEYRGYSAETLDFWKIRYCTEGELKDRIVMALEDVDRRLVGITGRATLPEQAEKFMHRPRNLHTGYFLTGLGRNLEYIREAYNTVKIVEGLFDSAKWWDCGHKNVACPIGIFFTDEHIRQLYKAGVTTLEFAFDNDKAGRNGTRKAIEKARGKFEIYCLVYPEGKDADDCTPEELQEVAANRLTVWEWYDKFGREKEE